jgi:hypothetical protein
MSRTRSLQRIWVNDRLPFDNTSDRIVFAESKSPHGSGLTMKLPGFCCVPRLSSSNGQTYYRLWLPTVK